ncbi:MAG: hypothetical protein K0R14_1658 [Burkholderiales bacterium]|jgi:hypothetical protein|nr:hypothetical protein [Burkholderiales bacterium]
MKNAREQMRSKSKVSVFGMFLILFLTINISQADEVVKCIYNDPIYQFKFNDFYKIKKNSEGIHERNRSVIEWLLRNDDSVGKISMDLLSQTKSKARGFDAAVVNGTIMRPHTLRPISCVSGPFKMDRIDVRARWRVAEEPKVQYWIMDPPFPHRSLILKCTVETAKKIKKDISAVGNEEENNSSVLESCSMHGDNDSILKSYEGDKEELPDINSSGSSIGNTELSPSNSAYGNSSSSNSSTTDANK